MTGGARTNRCSEQKAEDGRSFHRLSDGAITFLLRSPSLMLGTCGTCPDEACKSGFKAKTGLHRRPRIPARRGFRHAPPCRLDGYTENPSAPPWENPTPFLKLVSAPGPMARKCYPEEVENFPNFAPRSRRHAI